MTPALIPGVGWLPDTTKAGTAHEVACALLVTVQPTDRALAGWGIEPRQVAGLVAVAQRPPRGKRAVP